TRPKMRARKTFRVNAALLSVAAALTLSGCPSPLASKSADPTRGLSPVPACVRAFPQTGKSGFSIQLPEEDYWGLIVPAWTDKMDSGGDVLSCSGAPVFAEETAGKYHLAPAARMEGRITYGGGANRLKVVWLR